MHLPLLGGCSLEDGNPDARENIRSNVFLAAALKTSSGTIAVRIRNISAKGVLLEGATLPDQGSSAQLERGHLNVEGDIVWRRETQCGVHFGRGISVSEWVQRVGHSGQQKVDWTFAALKSAGTVVGPICEFDESSERRSVQSISAELDAICERMANLPDLSIQMAEEVLRLDALAHALRVSAKP
jgi:hypothetical protein